jgi:hypothetical protein
MELWIDSMLQAGSLVGYGLEKEANSGLLAQRAALVVRDETHLTIRNHSFTRVTPFP